MLLSRLKIAVLLFAFFGLLIEDARGQKANGPKVETSQQEDSKAGNKKLKGHTRNESPAKKDKGPAYIRIPKGELNFQLMGEFVGKVKTDSGSPETLALQVRAVGNDKFDAVAYRGGLPGQKKFEPDPTRLVGQRSDGFLILSGGPWAIFVGNDSCSVIARDGELLGKLKRVKRGSPTLFSPAPEGALVLFDGTSTENFTKAKMTSDGLLMEGADLMPMFQDFDLHIEFRLPYMPEADLQNRSNSGLYLQSRYECQILDSFATTPVYNGCGALYKFKAPDLNMCFPPLTWQTYDVRFTAPRWAADGSKLRDARISSWVNGVKVQDDVALPDKTGAGKDEEPILLPTKFQDHGDPVRFRNAWIVDRGLGAGEFPRRTTKQERAAANKAIQAKAKEARMKRAEALRLKKEKAAQKKKDAIEEFKKAEEALKKAQAPATPNVKKQPKKEQPKKEPAKKQAPKKQKEKQKKQTEEKEAAQSKTKKVEAQPEKSKKKKRKQPRRPKDTSEL